MGTNKNSWFVSLRNGYVEDEEAEPFENFFLGAVLGILGADCEDVIVTGIWMLEKQELQKERKGESFENVNWQMGFMGLLEVRCNITKFKAKKFRF